MSLAVGFQTTVGMSESFPVASATIEFSRGFSNHGGRGRIIPRRVSDDWMVDERGATWQTHSPRCSITSFSVQRTESGSSDRKLKSASGHNIGGIARKHK